MGWLPMQSTLDPVLLPELPPNPSFDCTSYLWNSRWLLTWTDMQPASRTWVPQVWQGLISKEINPRVLVIRARSGFVDSQTLKVNYNKLLCFFVVLDFFFWVIVHSWEAHVLLQLGMRFIRLDRGRHDTINIQLMQETLLIFHTEQLLNPFIVC